MTARGIGAIRAEPIQPSSDDAGTAGIHGRGIIVYKGMMGHAAALLGLAAIVALPASAHAQAPAAPSNRAVKSTVKVLDRRLPDDGAKPDAAVRGRLLGRGYQLGWIEAGAELKMEQQFLAGQPATVAVTAPGAAPLVLTVAEPGEQPVCRAARGCRWRPIYTQRYAITLRNPGATRVRYYLIVE